MFAAILAFITGLAGPLAQVAGKITDLQQARLKAETDQEKQKIDASIEEAHDRRQEIVAEAGNRIAGVVNAMMRAYIAIGPASYICKYYFWDKVVGSFVGCAQLKAMRPGCETFVTDGLTPSMAGVMTAVVAFYLAYDLTARFRR